MPRILWKATVVTALLALAVLPAGAAAQTVEGERLYEQQCASCHGPEGRGTERGPSLVGVGAASAHFQLTTGRMPLADPGAQAVRKPPAFSEPEIAALVDYVASLDGGPPVPDVELAGADLSEGQRLFIENCAACHGAIGAGGAVGSNAFAPSLYAATPVQIAEAMITGPGQMPRFSFPPDERDAIVAYVVALRSGPDPGGADIGGIGPVPEGWVAWVLGMVSLVVVCALVGRRRAKEGA